MKDIYKPAWKKNYRKIPQFILKIVNGMTNNEIVVASVKRISESDIVKGKYRHLGMKIISGNISYPRKILPRVYVGKYSRQNIEGAEIIRKDLPMITKTYAVETPNYGNWSRGSHDVYRDREVYVREYIPPKLLEIEIDLIAEEGNGEKKYVFKYKIDEVLDKTTSSFKTDLLNGLNILQENVGNVNVYESDAKLSDYLKTIYINWEILPPGSRDTDIAKIISKFKVKSEEDKERIIERYDVLSDLEPAAFISGTSGFRRYFGAMFLENLVVFENLEYGNAIYVMYEDWQVLSKKNRVELLTGNNQGFDRVIHTKGWKSQLRYLIRSKIEENN